jgi:site-specific recombinase
MAVWLERNIAGLGGNISLGLMLGIIPSVAVFFGLPLDVRHVTLSTGQVTAAFAALGGEHFWMLSTVWIVISICGIGLLNIVVSFSLALFVAIRARNLRGPERHQFYRALVGRFLNSPFSFLLPIDVTSTPYGQNKHPSQKSLPGVKALVGNLPRCSDTCEAVTTDEDKPAATRDLSIGTTEERAGDQAARW